MSNPNIEFKKKKHPAKDPKRVSIWRCMHCGYYDTFAAYLDVNMLKRPCYHCDTVGKWSFVRVEE